MSDEIGNIDLEVLSPDPKPRGRKAKDKEKNIETNFSGDAIEKLNQVRKAIETKYGKDSIFKFDEQVNVEKISTNILGLDEALGEGFPKGRIIEISGVASAGKSLLALHTVSQEQKRGKQCAYIDAERSLSPEWLKKLGVDLTSLLIVEPESQEQAFQIAEDLISSQSVSIIVIDSSNALIPQAELDGEFGDSHMGLQARGWSQFLRRITGLLAKTKTTLLIISQIRQKIGVTYGSNEVVGVGTAITFYSSQRLDVRKVETINGNTANDDPTGNRIRVKVTKNKIAPPFRKVELVVSFDTGISVYDDTLDQAVKYNVIQKSGSWFNFGEERWQGSKNVVASLQSNPELYNTIFEATKKAMSASK